MSKGDQETEVRHQNLELTLLSSIGGARALLRQHRRAQHGEDIAECVRGDRLEGGAPAQVDEREDHSRDRGRDRDPEPLVAVTQAEHDRAEHDAENEAWAFQPLLEAGENEDPLQFLHHAAPENPDRYPGQQIRRLLEERHDGGSARRRPGEE